MENLPEFYIGDENQRISAPTYEALQQCYIVMASAETGQVGPTLIEPGEHFSTDQVPCHAWRPLNRQAGVQMQRWLDSLSLDSGLTRIPQECINEAAFKNRPREGDPELTREQWWAQVMRDAAELAAKRRGEIGQMRPAVRPMRQGDQSPMPFVSTSPAYPTDVGRAPPAQSVAPGPNAPQRRTPQKARQGNLAMPNANETPSPSSAAG